MHKSIKEFPLHFLFLLAVQNINMYIYIYFLIHTFTNIQTYMFGADNTLMDSYCESVYIDNTHLIKVSFSPFWDRKLLKRKSLETKTSWNWKLLKLKTPETKNSWNWKLLKLKTLETENSWDWKLLKLKTPETDNSWNWKLSKL